jgi:hypothetical protein
MYCAFLDYNQSTLYIRRKQRPCVLIGEVSVCKLHAIRQRRSGLVAAISLCSLSKPPSPERGGWEYQFRMHRPPILDASVPTTKSPDGLIGSWVANDQRIPAVYLIYLFSFLL